MCLVFVFISFSGGGSLASKSIVIVGIKRLFLYNISLLKQIQGISNNVTFSLWLQNQLFHFKINSQNSQLFTQTIIVLLARKP